MLTPHEVRLMKKRGAVRTYDREGLLVWGMRGGPT